MKRLLAVSVVVFLMGVGVGFCLPRNVTVSGDGLPSFSAPPTAQHLTDTQPTEPEDWPLTYTTLVARELISYDGPYWEDGGTEDVFGVAALILENTGTVGIEYARLTVEQAGRTLCFDATYIPPKSKVMILEENRAPYMPGPITDCHSRTVIPGNFDLEKRKLLVQEVGLSGLKITNLTEETLSGVRICYKLWYGEENLYSGGITYSTTLRDLAPGESRILQPWRYAAGYSRVVAVMVE